MAEIEAYTNKSQQLESRLFFLEDEVNFEMEMFFFVHNLNYYMFVF